MKIGIICAGDRELEPYLPHIKDCKTSKKAMLTFYEGTINEVDIVTLFCGVCKTNAAIATQILIDNYHVDMIINAGTAGGMDDSLDIFDTVISTEVAHHDVHAGILTEFHPWMPSVFFKSDDLLVELSKIAIKRISLEHKIYYGRMVTGECFITDDGRDEINFAFKPLTVDMETASIAHTCFVNEIPFVAIRTLADTSTHSGVENFDKNVVTASEISMKIVLELLNELKQK
ncbi:MAG: 5'-methylthioadenosine/S-adenosylhomocysteine nucleosidase [Defluviitaleaceae bacterium]|nr:5'-methylthioadenosine/S-adenosylhomocysteine nucleosidase [Defluviitaleaceae bacterium]